jgi:hypothetical protein
VLERREMPAAARSPKKSGRAIASRPARTSSACCRSASSANWNSSASAIGLPKDPAFFSVYPDGRHLFFWQDERKTLRRSRSSRRAMRWRSEVRSVSGTRLARRSGIAAARHAADCRPKKPGDFVEYLKLLGASAIWAARDHRPRENLHAKRRRPARRMVRIARDQSHARDRWRHRRQRRPAFRRHRLHPDAPLHGRRVRQARTLGIRAGRHGRGLGSHRRLGAQPKARRFASTRR